MKADPKPLFNTHGEFIFKWRLMSKFTLRFFKKKEFIQYISSFFLKDCWDIV